jgi:hypothetical protein
VVSPTTGSSQANHRFQIITQTSVLGNTYLQEDLPSDYFPVEPAVFPYWADWYGYAPNPTLCVQDYGVYYYVDNCTFGVEWFVGYYAAPDEITTNYYRLQFSAQTYAATPGVWTYKYYVIPDRTQTDLFGGGPEIIGAQKSQDGPSAQFFDLASVTNGTSVICDTNVGNGTCTLGPTICV